MLPQLPWDTNGVNPPARLRHHHDLLTHKNQNFLPLTADVTQLLARGQSACNLSA